MPRTTPVWSRADPNALREHSETRSLRLLRHLTAPGPPGPRTPKARSRGVRNAVALGGAVLCVLAVIAVYVLAVRYLVAIAP